MAFCETLFADHLGNHRLLSNRSLWLSFTTLKCRRWVHENVVLLGDAAHTAHFSIGSGTKLALEDSIALAQAFEQHDDLTAALRTYRAGATPARRSHPARRRREPALLRERPPLPWLRAAAVCVPSADTLRKDHLGQPARP